jgi:hypothetical protein
MFNFQYGSTAGEIDPATTKLLYKELPIFDPPVDRFLKSALKPVKGQAFEKYADIKVGERLRDKYLNGEPLGAELYSGKGIYDPVVDNSGKGIKLRKDVVATVIISELSRDIEPEPELLSMFTLKELYTTHFKDHADISDEDMVHDVDDAASKMQDFFDKYTQELSPQDELPKAVSSQKVKGKRGRDSASDEPTASDEPAKKKIDTFMTYIDEHGEKKCDEVDYRILRDGLKYFKKLSLKKMPLLIGATGHNIHSWIIVIIPILDGNDNIMGYSFYTFGGGVGETVDTAYARWLNARAPDAQLQLTIQSPDLFLDPSKRTWINSIQYAKTKTLSKFQKYYIDKAECLCIFDSVPNHAPDGAQLSSFLYDFKRMKYSKFVGDGTMGYLTNRIFSTSENCASVASKIMGMEAQIWDAYLYRPSSIKKHTEDQILSIIAYWNKYGHVESTIADVDEIIDNFEMLISDNNCFLQGTLGKTVKQRLERRKVVAAAKSKKGGSIKRSRRTLKKK